MVLYNYMIKIRDKETNIYTNIDTNKQTYTSLNMDKILRCEEINEDYMKLYKILYELRLMRNSKTRFYKSNKIFRKLKS